MRAQKAGCTLGLPGPVPIGSAVGLGGPLVFSEALSSLECSSCPISIPLLPDVGGSCYISLVIEPLSDTLRVSVIV